MDFSLEDLKYPFDDLSNDWPPVASAKSCSDEDSGFKDAVVDSICSPIGTEPRSPEFCSGSPLPANDPNFFGLDYSMTNTDYGLEQLSPPMQTYCSEPPVQSPTTVKVAEEMNQAQPTLMQSWMTSPDVNFSSNINFLDGIGDINFDLTEFLNGYDASTPESKQSEPLSEAESALIGDDELIKLSVKALNKRLKDLNLPEEQTNWLKKRRRTLKNRGYAQTCRFKRNTAKEDLELRLARTEQERDQFRSSSERYKSLYEKAAGDLKKLTSALFAKATFARQQQARLSIPAPPADE